MSNKFLLKSFGTKEATSFSLFLFTDRLYDELKMKKYSCIRNVGLTKAYHIKFFRCYLNIDIFFKIVLYLQRAFGLCTDLIRVIKIKTLHISMCCELNS